MDIIEYGIAEAMFFIRNTINNSMQSFKQYFNESSQKSFEDLVRENTFMFDDLLYHATSIQALYSICSNREFIGNSHGVTEEEYTISTSINSNITQYFSRDEHKVVFIFGFNPALKVFSLPEWLHSIHTSSGLSFDDVDDEEVERLCAEYGIEKSAYGLRSNYLNDNLPDDYMAFCQEYVYKQYISTGREPPLSDEAEITFIERGLGFLFDNISSIIVDNEEFYTVDECLDYLQEKYDEDYLNQEIDR